MKKILPLIVSVLVCVSLVAFIVMSDKPTAQEEGAVSQASEAAAKIVVLDVQHLLSNSLAAKDIKEQAKKLTEDFEKELKELDADLRKKHEKVIKDNKDKSNEDKVKARRQFEEELKKANDKANDRRIKLAKAVEGASQELRGQIMNIVASMAPKNGYEIVLTRQNIVIVSQKFDITSAVMDELNKEVDAIKLKVE
jgi:Skp family chaperone for outer membrane proteins